MPLGTLDRTPPPFFRQGPSALTKLVFFSGLAVFLMVADGRMGLIEPLRSGLAVVLLPVQRVLMAPVALWDSAHGYLRGLDHALREARSADERVVEQSRLALRAEQLQTENERLRSLLDLRPALPVRTQAAEILYDAADAFSRKVFIDRGLAQGVVAGAPVVNDAGVLGQVTRVYPLTSEVTLLIDKDAAIPVLNTRTQQRSVAFGGHQLPSGGALELRFLPANADVQVGDALVTSGLDGIYPPGLPVARVAIVERRGQTSFARILLEPAARTDAVRHVLLIEPPMRQMPPRPGDDASAAEGRPATPAASAASAPPGDPR